MRIWSINYYILKMSRYTSIVYIGRYLVLAYIERFISTVCCFFSYTCWSVNCMTWWIVWVFFWHAQKKRQDLYLRALVLSFVFLVLFSLFYLVRKFFKRLFQPLCQSVNSMSWVFESYNIPQRCPVTLALT